MTGVDSSELILLLIIGLIVLGPKRLPEIANTIGGWIGQARRMTRVLRRQLEEELAVDVTPSIKPPAHAEARPDPAAPDPADPASDIDGDAEESLAAEEAHHVPNDDDSYSPLHEDDEGDDVPEEKRA